MVHGGVKKSNSSVIYLNEWLDVSRRGRRKVKGKRTDDYFLSLLFSSQKENFSDLGSELFNKNVEKFVEKAQSAGVRPHTANTLRSLH
jgi:hypothetical protein